jgi:hypothetical protein
VSQLRESLLKVVKRNLDTLNLKYAIQLEDGRVVGELQLAPTPTKLTKKGKQSDPSPYSSHELHPIVEPYLRGLEPGRQIHIPAGKYQVRYFARTVSTMCHELFGAGMYNTKRDETGVNVMRMKKDSDTFDWSVATQESLNL